MSEPVDNAPMDAEGIEKIRSILTRHFPALQAIYLFGSAAQGDISQAGDIDIALLLPEKPFDEPGYLGLSPARSEIEDALSLPVDLVSIRYVSLVFKKEIIFTGRRIFTADADAADIFEMLTLSFYQILNEERREILAEVFRSGRMVQV